MSLTNQKELTLFKTDNKISILTLFNFIVHTCVFIFMYKIFIKNGDTTVEKKNNKNNKKKNNKRKTTKRSVR